MGKFELRVLYARATARLWEKIERLRKLPDLRISDFGTRRRHSFLWQDWCVEAMIEGLGAQLHRLVELPHRHEARHRGDRHQRPRAAHGLRRAGRGRRGAGGGALPGAGELAARLRRQPADHPARHLRHQGVPEAGAGLAGVLDRHPHRLRRAGGGRRDRDRLVGEPRPGSAREAGHLLRRAGRRADRGALRTASTAG